LDLDLVSGFYFWTRQVHDFCLPNLKNEIRSRQARPGQAKSSKTATNLADCCSRTGAIDRTSKTGASHQEKYGFSFKPGQDAQKGDPCHADAKMKTKSKSKSALCKGIKHFDQAIIRLADNLFVRFFIVFQRAKIKTKHKNQEKIVKTE